MGQYHLVVNADKRQYIHPHRLGDGLKLMEFANSEGGTMTALAILLAVSNGDGGRGGGDLRFSSEVVGSWGGDRIAIVGDYAEDTDLPTTFDPQPSSLYSRCLDAGKLADPSMDGLPTYRDITADVRACIEADGMYAFAGDTDGYMQRTMR